MSVANLVFDIDDPSGCRSDPFGGDETLHTGLFGGLDPGNLEMEMFPCNAGDQDIDFLQLIHQSSPWTVQIIPDNLNTLFLQVLVGTVVDRDFSRKRCDRLRLQYLVRVYQNVQVGGGDLLTYKIS